MIFTRTLGCLLTQCLNTLIIFSGPRFVAERICACENPGEKPGDVRAGNFFTSDEVGLLNSNMDIGRTPGTTDPLLVPFSLRSRLLSSSILLLGRNVFNDFSLLFFLIVKKGLNTGDLLAIPYSPPLDADAGSEALLG